MCNILLALLMLVNMTALAADRPNPGPVASDDMVILLYPVLNVDVPVLENDKSSNDDLWVVSATRVGGGKLEVIERSAVRVFIDPSSYFFPPGSSGGQEYGLIAQGTYVVSNGEGQASARWTVWYFPEVLP